MSWNRAYSKALTEQNLLIFSIARTSKRENNFHWVANICDMPSYLWSLSSHPLQKVKDLNQIKQQPVAIKKNSLFADYLTEQGFSKIFQVEGEKQALGLLLRKEAVFTMSGQYMSEKINEMNVAPNQFKRLHEFKDFNIDMHIAFSKNTDDTIVKQYNTAFNYLMRTKQIEKLRQKWNVQCF